MLIKLLGFTATKKKSLSKIEVAYQKVFWILNLATNKIDILNLENKNVICQWLIALCELKTMTHKVTQKHTGSHVPLPLPLIFLGPYFISQNRLIFGWMPAMQIWWLFF